MDNGRDNDKLLRLPDVLALIPISRSSWLAGAKNGRYPAGFLLSPRTRVWRYSDIAEVMARGSGKEAVRCANGAARIAESG